MIDAATPLLGMVMRMHTLSGSPLPDKLYQQVVTDIQAIEQQLQSQGYERVRLSPSAMCSVPLLMKPRWVSAGTQTTAG